MTVPLLYSFTAILLFGISLYTFVAARHLLRKVLALNVMGSSIFLFLIAMARRSEVPDPVPHAMVLTGIVVAVSATAFAVALIRRIHDETGQVRLPEDAGDV